MLNTVQNEPVNAKFTNSFKRSLAKYSNLFTNNRIEKFYNDRIHIIEIGNDAFLYEGKKFASLSNVVKAIRVGKTGISSPAIFFKAKDTQ